MKKILSFMLLMASFTAFAGYDIVQMKEEKREGKELVQEVFYYACGHCKQIEPKVITWKETLSDNIIFEKVPVVLSPKQTMAAKHYYAAVFLNVEKDFSMKYFKAISYKNPMSDKLAKSIMMSLGEKSQKIDAAFNSHWVETKIKEAKELTLKLKVSTVPLFLVNNKFVLKRSDYENDEKLFKELTNLTK
jgi:thiol:disulfide interchange protein DsbA